MAASGNSAKQKWMCWTAWQRMISGQQASGSSRAALTLMLLVNYNMLIAYAEQTDHNCTWQNTAPYLHLACQIATGLPVAQQESPPACSRCLLCAAEKISDIGLVFMERAGLLSSWQHMQHDGVVITIQLMQAGSIEAPGRVLKQSHAHGISKPAR